MITQWTISNFKSIKEPLTLRLAPLTIFSGANSSGKSAMMQSILMVAQSFASLAKEDSLILNGRFVQLGHFDDVLHYGNEDQPMEIGFNLVSRQTDLTVSTRIKIIKGRALRSVSRTFDRLQPRVDEVVISFSCPEYGQARRLEKLIVRLIEDAKLFPRLDHLSPALRQQIKRGIFDYELVMPAPEKLVSSTALERVLRVSLNNLIPGHLLVGINAELRGLIEDIEYLSLTLNKMADDAQGRIPSDLPTGFLSPLVGEVIPLIRYPRSWDDRTQSRYNDRRKSSEAPGSPGDILDLLNMLRKRAGAMTWTRLVSNIQNSHFPPGLLNDLARRIDSAKSEYLRKRVDFVKDHGLAEVEVRLFPTQYVRIFEQVREILGRQVYYLGPLRADPRVVYEAPVFSDRISVGLKGEYTAAMLDEFRNMEVDYPVPPVEFVGEYQVQRAPLIEALLAWLRRMELGETVDTEETSKVGYRLSISSSSLDKPLDLTSVGVGVSQVLPTLVMALLAPKDSILLFEQPELHLHPKVQSILGDFFLGMTACNKQCLVETHSEHIINRIRRRIVESTEANILRRLKIYFVEKKGAESEFRVVEPNEYGSILEWPQGFFDEVETQSDLIFKAQMEKRLKARQQRAKETR
jgi:predicted ATPase